MNKKQVVKATVTYYHCEPQQMYGIIVDDNRILLEDGKLCNLDSPVLQVSATRNVPSEIRAALEEALPKVIAMDKAQEQIKTLDKRLKELNQEIGVDLPAKIRSARGLLSRTEFVSEFMNNLTPDIRVALGSVSTQFFSNDLIIERSVDVEKWYRTENEICYQEYDGEMFIRDGAEKTKTYQDIVKKYSHPLPVKECAVNEGLCFGDKSTLMYFCSYTISVAKPLTKEYAKELADKFCGVKTAERKPNNYERD